MTYLHWNEKTVTDFSDSALDAAFNEGYVFTRLGRGAMQQTRSVRVDLSKFSLSSENRRILKKVPDFNMTTAMIPFPDYTFAIGKLAKDFYETKFGPGIMSANKMKEMVTDIEKSNFNRLLIYTVNGEAVGYTIAFKNADILHYSYPFYDLAAAPKDMGLAMMLTAVLSSKEKGLKYVYLGSLQRPSDTYKLQFSGIEWFDGKNWSTDLEEVKKILAASK